MGGTLNVQSPPSCCHHCFGLFQHVEEGKSKREGKGKRKSGQQLVGGGVGVFVCESGCASWFFKAAMEPSRRVHSTFLTVGSLSVSSPAILSCICACLTFSVSSAVHQNGACVIFSLCSSKILSLLLYRCVAVSLFTCPPVELRRRHLISCLAYSLPPPRPHVCVIGDTHELRGSCCTVKQQPRVPALNETKKTVTFVLGKAEQWMDSLCISSTGVVTHKHAAHIHTHTQLDIHMQKL